MSKTIDRHASSGALVRSLEEFAARNGMSTEHVLLEGDEEFSTATTVISKIYRRIDLVDSVSETRTVFELYDDGMLRVTEAARNRSVRDISVDLRHLTSRRFIDHSGHRVVGLFACVSAALAVSAMVLAYWNIDRHLTIPAALVTTCLTAFLIRLLLRRVEERIGFRTRHGLAFVPILTTRFGSIRKGRQIAATLAAAIRHFKRRERRSKPRRLRAEIREHYRLAETGAITSQSCSAGITRTLAAFDT